ncbi:DUF502 domain-containing protein [Methylophaga sp.]|uniref:DUF502 domain-containing protein n=1 Tax=Methylophaga sp. TaxID=2024840 RepID=UPI003F6A186E
MFGTLARLFITGLITILPVMLTLYLVSWFVITTEQALGQVIKFILPDYFYWPGMGVVAGIGLVFAIGILMQTYVVKILFSKIEEMLYHMPLIKSVYGAIRDFFQYFSPGRKNQFQQVVAVQFENGMELIGFVTISSSEDLPVIDGDEEERVLVYLPMSYNVGGYPVMIAKSKLRNVDMTMEQAMRFIITAGVAFNNGDNH